MSDIRWKFVVVVAILAMTVSLLSGGLSGIGLGTLLLRALIGGLIFALLAVGLNLLVARFFPEILNFYNEVDVSGGGGRTAGDDDVTGTRIDIVMPSEGPGNVDSDTASRAGEVNAGEVPADGESSQGNENGEAETGAETGAEPIGDLDRFSSDFSDLDDERPGKSSPGDGPMADHDVEEIAQAIHTVITRDGKG